MALIKNVVKPNHGLRGNRCAQFPLNGYCEVLKTDVPVLPAISNINEVPLVSFYLVMENSIPGPTERIISTEWPSTKIGL